VFLPRVGGAERPEDGCGKSTFFSFSLPIVMLITLPCRVITPWPPDWVIPMLKMIWRFASPMARGARKIAKRQPCGIAQL